GLYDELRPPIHLHRAPPGVRAGGGHPHHRLRLQPTGRRAPGCPGPQNKGLSRPSAPRSAQPFFAVVSGGDHGASEPPFPTALSVTRRYVAITLPIILLRGDSIASLPLRPPTAGGLLDTVPRLRVRGPPSRTPVLARLAGTNRRRSHGGRRRCSVHVFRAKEWLENFLA